MKPSRPAVAATAIAPYAVFADVLLRAEAAASAVVGEVDVALLVGRLPSFDSGSARTDTLRVVRNEIDAARKSLHDDIERGESNFATLVHAAGFDTAAAETLAIIAAVEGHLDRQRLVASLNADPSSHRATIGLIDRILGNEGVLALASDRRLATAGLITVATTTTWARAEVSLATDVTFLLAVGHQPAPPRGATLIEALLPATAERLVLVPGKDPSRSRQVATESLGGAIVIAKNPSDSTAWGDLVRFATLTGRGVVVHVGDELESEGSHAIERADHIRWAIVSTCELPIDQLPHRPWREIPAGDPTATADELAAAFGADSAITHRLTAHQAEMAARAFDHVDPDPDRAVRRLASGELDRLAVRIRPDRGWDDLILPDEQLALVRGVVDRYNHRTDVYERWGFKPVPSAGVVAMFSGPPGTGKTLSAEVVAKEIGLDLYRIDLSSLVSKYIGETEKNLEKIFQAAEGGTMVLLFDEADAVFGKRSEVSDANDKHANVETSYLLQRLENYDGVVILTTNYASNIDSAFMRRIHVTVEFTAPDETERLRLWALSFPPAAPLGNLDLPLLARRFKLSGSSIRSVALGAAFRAAAAGRAIDMDLIVESLRSELRKQGRVATSGDLLSEPDAVPGLRGSRRN
jgi:ATPase family associated with various cellular activities (AAA)